MESGSSLDDISIIEEDPNDYCDMMPSKDLRVGDFILVKFLCGKKLNHLQLFGHYPRSLPLQRNNGDVPKKHFRQESVYHENR